MDDGEPTQLSSTTRVVIQVEDANDNAPEFDQKTYNVEIPSNAKINQKLFQVSLASMFVHVAISIAKLYEILLPTLYFSHSYRPLNHAHKKLSPLSHRTCT